jgi:DNA-binding transcriptional LysR family regulator
VRWLDEAIQSPKTSFNSNSIIAQCSAAEDGMGIAMLPTFVAAAVPGLVRLIPDQVMVRRDVWMSVRVEQSALARIQGVMKFLSHVFSIDADFLMGRTERLEGSQRKRASGSR